MAAVALPPPPQEDPVLTSFRSYVVQRRGAAHVTEKAVKAAFEAEIAKPYGKESLLVQIQAHENRRDNPYHIWKTDPYWFNGTWHSDTTKFVLDNIYNTTIKEKVSAYFPGGHFGVHGSTKIGGWLWFDDPTFEGLNGSHWATICTKPGGECGNEFQLNIDWYSGPQHDIHLASFTSEDFPFKIDPGYQDPDSKWSVLTTE